MKDRVKRRILIVDDHPLAALSLETAINAHPDLTVIGLTGSADEALHLIGNDSPDLVIVDISLPGANGLDLIKQIQQRGGATPGTVPAFLVLSVHDEALYAPRALKAGALGYVGKQEDLPQILAAVRTVLSGNVLVSEAMRERLRDDKPEPAAAPPFPGIEALSDRELEVYEFIGRGVRASDIAEHLGISVRTVETHQANIKKKLKLASASELTRHAMQWLMERDRPLTP